MSTTEPIIIPIEGDPSDFVKDSAKVNAELDKMAKGTKAASGANTGMASSAKAASFSITDLRSSYMLAMEAARVAGQVWQATGQEFVNYAEQVKNMSRSLGASAEETSRLIQVADDVRVSYDTLKIAMKEAQKDGIDPSIEGLAKLSDQYLALAPGVERTKFLLDKFGKSGLEMGKLMEKGGAGIRAASKAVSENLIMTEKGIQKSDDYQRKLDDLTDSWDGMAMAIGDVAIEPVTNALENLNYILITTEQGLKDASAGLEAFTEKNKIAGRFIDAVWKTFKDMNPVLHLFDDNSKDAADSTDDLTNALGDNSGALLDNKDAVKEAETALNNYKDMLKEVSQANQEAESFMQSYADFQEQYAKDHNTAVAMLAKAERDYAESVKENGARSDDALTKLGDIDLAKEAIQDLEATWHESTNKMIYDMALAKVSVDGLTNAEFAATQDLAVQMGLRTQAQADEAKAMMDKAQTIADGIALQEDVMKEKAETDAELLRLEEEKKAAAEGTTTAIVDGSAVSAEALGTVAQAVDSATQSYQAMAQAAWDAAAAAQSAAGSSSSSGSSGGSSPDERDGSSVSSSSVSKNSTLNISIHNPRGENSASSVRRALKLTSYLGHPI